MNIGKSVWCYQRTDGIDEHPFEAQIVGEKDGCWVIQYDDKVLEAKKETCSSFPFADGEDNTVAY